MLPSHTKTAIDAYVEQGVPTGDFLYAVLTNDLFLAIGKADDKNKVSLFDICVYIYNYTPSFCWGSPKKIKEWLGMFGEKRESIEAIIDADRENRKNYKV